MKRHCYLCDEQFNDLVFDEIVGEFFCSSCLASIDHGE
jgi:hypothetical protein